MKLTMQQISKGEDEVIVRYQELNETVEAIANIVQKKERRIIAISEGKTVLLLPEKVFYLESVDGAAFAYLKNQVYRVSEGLGKLAKDYEGYGFFRCSKSMVINIYKIDYLKSESGNRIRATMENGEQVMISRAYAKQLRQILKGEDDE